MEPKYKAIYITDPLHNNRETQESAIRCQLTATASSYQQVNTTYAAAYNNHERKC